MAIWSTQHLLGDFQLRLGIRPREIASFFHARSALFSSKERNAFFCISQDWAHRSCSLEFQISFYFVVFVKYLVWSNSISIKLTSVIRWHFPDCQRFHNPQHLKILENMSVNVSGPNSVTKTAREHSELSSPLVINHQHSHCKRNLLIYTRWEYL